MDVIQECFGWLGACMNITFYLSPIMPFINVLKGKISFEDTPGIYVTTCYVNCFIWYIYGDMIFSDQVKISNFVSAIICLILILIYLIFELRRYFIDAILNLLILITGSWAVYRALTIIVDDDRVIGNICIGTTLIIFISPIQILYKVINDKNYNLIPVVSALFYLFSCSFWLIYAIFIKDFYLGFTHSLGIILSSLELMVFFNYKKKYLGIGDRVTDSTLDIDTGNNDEIKKDDISMKQIKEKPVEIVTKLDS